MNTITVPVREVAYEEAAKRGYAPYLYERFFEGALIAAGEILGEPMTTQEKSIREKGQRWFAAL